MYGQLVSCILGEFKNGKQLVPLLIAYGVPYHYLSSHDDKSQSWLRHAMNNLDARV